MIRQVLVLVALHAAVMIGQLRSLRRFRLHKTCIALFTLLGLNLALSLLLAFGFAPANPVEWVDAVFGPFAQTLLQP